jgi:hypothetical protein
MDVSVMSETSSVESAQARPNSGNKAVNRIMEEVPDMAGVFRLCLRFPHLTHLSNTVALYRQHRIIPCKPNTLCRRCANVPVIIATLHVKANPLDRSPNYAPHSEQGILHSLVSARMMAVSILSLIPLLGHGRSRSAGSLTGVLPWQQGGLTTCS